MFRIINYVKSYCKTPPDQKLRLINEMNKRNQLLEDEIQSLNVRFTDNKKCFKCEENDKTKLNHFCPEAIRHSLANTHYYCNDCLRKYIYELESLFISYD
jgi:hypothetical protein